MTNLFDNAAKKPVAKKATAKATISLPTLEADLERMEEINTKMAELKAEKDGLDYNVRSTAKEAFEAAYEAESVFPGTMVVEAGKMTFQFIGMDKYIKIDEDRASELEAKYGENVVTEDTTYSFNNALLKKYKNVISDALMNNEKIEDDDKSSLIVATTAWSVAKGTIKNFRNTLFGFASHKVSELVEDINPIFMVRGVKSKA